MPYLFQSSSAVAHSIELYIFPRQTLSPRISYHSFLSPGRAVHFSQVIYLADSAIFMSQHAHEVSLLWTVLLHFNEFIKDFFADFRR